MATSKWRSAAAGRVLSARLWLQDIVCRVIGHRDIEVSRCCYEVARPVNLRKQFWKPDGTATFLVVYELEATIYHTLRCQRCYRLDVIPEFQVTEHPVRVQMKPSPNLEA